MRRALPLVAAVVVLLAACSGSSGEPALDETSTAPEGTAAAATTAAPATTAPVATVAAASYDFSLPGPPAQRVELTTVNGVTLVADLYRGGPDAFVFGHGNNGDRSGLDALAAGFALEGFTVVNVDLRGHGESGARLARAEGAARVFVIGLQMSGTAALQMAVTGDGGFDGVVAMFAPPTYHGLNAEAGIDHVSVPTMYFSTDVRGGSVKWANQLYDQAPEPKHLLILPAGPAAVAFADFARNDFMVGVLEFLELA